MSEKYEEIYDVFCEAYEDDGSHDEMFKAKLIQMMKGFGERTWVNVKDRLPKKEVDVIIYKNGYVEWKCAYITKHGWTYVGGSYFDNVTHWMPLPKKP